MGRFDSGCILWNRDKAGGGKLLGYRVLVESGLGSAWICTVSGSGYGNSVLGGMRHVQYS